MTQYDYGDTMQSMKIAISIPDNLFADAEALAMQLRVPRSQLYALALSEFIANRDEDVMVRQLNAVYAEQESSIEPALLHAQLSSLNHETW